MRNGSRRLWSFLQDYNLEGSGGCLKALEGSAMLLPGELLKGSFCFWGFERLILLFVFFYKAIKGLIRPLRA